MTIIEAINRIDNIKPNNYSQAEKVKWLSTLDGMVKAEIIDTHDGDEGADIIEYTENDTTSTLIIPAPYDDVYIKWLEAQIDYANNEYGKYNNSASAFNTAYASFAGSYHRSHMPKGKKLKFF